MGGVTAHSIISVKWVFWQEAEGTPRLARNLNNT